MSDQSQGKKSHKDEQIAEALAISRRTVIRIKQRFCQESLELALTGAYPRERPEQRVLDGKSEAQLILLACSEAPDGRKRWTLELLADRMVRLGYVEYICPETVRTALKNNELKPWLKKSWCFPKIEDAEFVWRMEDVLDVYCRPYDPTIPLLCMDEMGKNLVADKHAPEPAEPGKVAREDYTYEKKGRSNVFIACEPLAGKRYLKVTEQRTKKDWALFMQEVLEEHYPDARKIALVMDNLNTHSPASFYEVFEPAKAKALADRLEIHYTPKHASWLNISEIELSVLVRQGLKLNIATLSELCWQVQQWQDNRNQQVGTVNWQFRTADARIKLKRLYPVLQSSRDLLEKIERRLS
jgi:hypothetical protein